MRSFFLDIVFVLHAYVCVYSSLVECIFIQPLFIVISKLKEDMLYIGKARVNYLLLSIISWRKMLHMSY